MLSAYSLLLLYKFLYIFDFTDSIPNVGGSFGGNIAFEPT